MKSGWMARRTFFLMVVCTLFLTMPLGYSAGDHISIENDGDIAVVLQVGYKDGKYEIMMVRDKETLELPEGATSIRTLSPGARSLERGPSRVYLEVHYPDGDKVVITKLNEHLSFPEHPEPDARDIHVTAEQMKVSK